MSSLDRPIGYLFSDIEGSTERWEKTPAHMQVAVVRHDDLIDEIVARHGGIIHDRAGDGVFAIFETGNPLACALDIQLAMQHADWSAVGGLHLRVGVHADRGRDGITNRAAINRAARIMSSGWGGQIVISGQAATAFECPSGASLIDLGICHFKGIEEPFRLSGLIHPDLERTEFPPLRSYLVHGSAAPDLAGPIFGRHEEIAEVLSLLATQRLVTITGPGGNGKTRLAAQVASDQAAKRGVCFVSLQSISGAADLLPTIARALRFPFHVAARPEDQLIDYLRDKATLLVLDNAETIAGVAGFVTDLLNGCPQLTVLVTSREPLRLPNETCVRLSGIASPNNDVEDGERSAAVQLFLHEARQKDATFALSEHDIETFRRICQVVDGSPLALRLTAQWTNVLSLSEILERLQEGLSFLSAGRAQDGDSLRRVFEGSWRLLSADQRQALARLSVFAKSFDWQAAAGVARVDLETFATLERKGLLEQSASRRFVMHPLIHEYAREKLLEASEESVATRRRHSAYYLDAVCMGLKSMASRGQGVVLEELLRRDFPEVRLAWFYAVETNAKSLILKSIEPLCNFLWARSMFREALELFNAPTDDEGLRRYLTSIYANFLFHQGGAERAAAAASSVLAAPGGARGARAHAHQTLGNLAHTRGDYAQAQFHYERALAIRQRMGDLMGCCYTDLSLVALHLLVERTDEARRHVKSAYRLSRQVGDTFGMMASHMYAGDIATFERRLDDAQANFEKGLSLQDSAPYVRSMLHMRLGSLFVLRGDYENALRQHGEAHDLACELGDQRTQAKCLIEVGSDLRCLSRLDQAKAKLLRGVRLSMAQSMQPTLARGLLELARVELLRCKPDVARRLVSALEGADLGDLRPVYETLAAELQGDEPKQADAPAIQDLLNEIIAEADVDTLRL